MLPLSICIITKNEEHCLRTCLDSLKPLLSSGAQLVVTDTGSTDATYSVARTYTDHVYHFDWCDDFSAARNFCAAKAANDWILVLDADEAVQELSIQEFSDTLSVLPLTHTGMLTLINPTSSNATTVDPVARLYHRRHSYYKGIIHEQLFPIDGSSPQYAQIPLTLFHTGYTDTNITTQKAQRNLALLLKAYKDNPSDSYTLFQLGQTYRMLDMPQDALSYFEAALALDVNPELDYVHTLVECYGYTLLDLKQNQKALELYGVYDTFATRADFVFLMGVIAMNNGLFEQAITEFKKAVTIPHYSVKGVNSYSAYYNIGVIYECLGNKEEAIANYKKCGDFAPAVARLTVI
jgi:glycosyltransferase involved in cell wall biosynthesis